VLNDEECAYLNAGALPSNPWELVMKLHRSLLAAEAEIGRAKSALTRMGGWPPEHAEERIKNLLEAPL
jgi:hypothetical protein